MRPVETPSAWVAVGTEAFDPLVSAVGNADAVEGTSDVHTALLALAAAGGRRCLVHASALASRPRAALRALVKAAAPEEVLVLWGDTEHPDPRIVRAVESFGVRRVRTAADAVGAPPPTPLIPRADRARTKTIRGPDEAEFVDGCFRRLDRPDALCRFLLKTVAHATGAQRVSLMLLDGARTSLFVKAAKGLDPALVGRLRSSFSGGIAGRAASLGRAVVGRASNGGARGYVGSAYAVLPLGRAGSCEGVLNLTDLPGDRLPDESSMRMLVRLATRAGRALSAARRLEHAETLSATDELTSLPNRRSFERALRREFERARRNGTSLAIGLLDIDHFKEFNDRFGHPVGDRVLVQVARRLASTFRETDLLCRWGGEEFAALITGLPEGGVSEALAVMERARRAVGERPLALGPGLPCPMVSVSGGVAVFPADASDPTELLRRADAALYEAKRTGRDRVKRA